ncbi:telomere binding protein [Mortierella alpina]|uniref:Telomere binding protein n=1 Tax=Mortierella alpina TaxID=64518 RepID=A0A9P6J1S1_MORAP|nr:telomere binding protein [Mortierella alpina]
MSDAQDSESISAYIADLQGQVQASSQGLAAVIRVLAEPLSFLGVQTVTVPSDPLLSWTGPKEPTTARRLYFIKHLLPNHLEFILDNITVDWLSALPAAQQLALFDAYFVPASHQEPCGQFDKAVALDTISLYDYHEGCTVLYGRTDVGTQSTTQSQTDAIWDSFLSKLFSIPTRISNAYGASKTRIEHCFQETPFFQRQVNQLQECVERTATLEGDSSTRHTRAWAVGITKVLRLGYGKTFAESLVSACWNTHHSLESGLRRVLTASSSSTGTAQLLLTNVVEFLDREQLVFDKHSRLSPTSIENQHSKLGQAFVKALSVWSDFTFVHHASLDYQKSTHLLEMAVIPAFHDGMLNWLDLDSFQKRRISLVVAEEFSRAVDTIGASANFNLDDTDPEIKFARSLVELRDGCIPLSLSLTSEQEAGKAASGIDPGIQTGAAALLSKDSHKQLFPDSADEEDPDAVADPYAQVSAGDSNAESSEDEDDKDLKPYDMDYESDPNEDPEAVKKPKIAMPLYIRDLLSYMRAHEDHDKLVTGLQTAEELIRRKAGSLELEDYAVELANVLLLLQDNFDTPNFYQLREDALVALVVTAPLPVVGALSEQFYTKKNSLGQRISILNAIGRGAQELSGYEPPSIAKSTPSPKGAFGAINRGTGAAFAKGTSAATVRKPSFEAISTTIAMEKTRRFSQKSHIEARRSPPKANAFANLASVFLGGLLGRWGGNRGPGVERGYDALLKAPALLLKRFVLTVASLAHFAEQPLTSLKLPGDIGISANASSQNTRSMSRLSEASPYNADLIENLLFGLLILVTPSPSALSDELLVTEYFPEIMECQHWAMELWEEQKLKEGEDKSKMFCAALLQRCIELLRI